MGPRPDASRNPKLAGLARALALLGVLVPAALLSVMYLVSALVSVHFGTVVMGLTFLVAGMWLIIGGSDMLKRPGTNDEDDLFGFGAAMDQQTDTTVNASEPRPILFVLTVTMIAGWALVAVTM